MTMKQASALADLALNLKSQVSSEANQLLVKQCLIDAAAAAAAGWDSAAAKMATSVAVAGFGVGQSTPWFGSIGLTPLGAAFVNASAMSALDIDDGNRAARGHLGAAVVPVATVFGAQHQMGADTFAHAIIAGCEIGARLGAVESPAFYASGRWAGVGAAVAVGICRGFDHSTLTNAIALAIHAAPVLGPAGQRLQMTGHIKEGVPFGLLSGVTSALLAEAGYRGDPDAVESVGIYDIRRLADFPFGTSAFGRTYFKQYTCCRLAHAAIDAALAIQERGGIAPEDIASITVHTFRAAIELPNESHPASFESAQYSLPFCIAAALVAGKSSLLPLHPEALHSTRITELAARIRLVHQEDLDGLYPSTTPTQVVLETHSGSAHEEIRETAEGDPGRPFPNDVLLQKLRTLGRRSVPADVIEGIEELLENSLPSPADFENALRG